ILDVLARGATVAITTRRHASRLTDRVDIREALNKLVLLSCTPSAELAALARTLCRAQPDGQLGYTGDGAIPSIGPFARLQEPPDDRTPARRP
ncbi:MAG TPA: hypothetical protein VNA67_06440, partial [Pseudonocardiaceae bacterium]|nr:hypothetical protein [Pseudonocardiaceae bacterium]